MRTYRLLKVGDVITENCRCLIRDHGDLCAQWTNTPPEMIGKSWTRQDHRGWPMAVAKLEDEDATEKI